MDRAEKSQERAGPGPARVWWLYNRFAETEMLNLSRAEFLRYVQNLKIPYIYQRRYKQSHVLFLAKSSNDPLIRLCNSSNGKEANIRYRQDFPATLENVQLEY